MATIASLFLVCVMTHVCLGMERLPHPCPFRIRSDGHRVGHLEQLGCQRPPLGPVPEYLTQPTPRELWENHVKPYRPAVLRNALHGSPALDLWNDKYLTETYGDQEVLVEKKYEDRKSEPKRMELKDFLVNYHKYNWYVVSMLPDAMRRDIRVPQPLMCGTFRKNLAELNLWIGTNGTRSMLHYDADNIMHCVVSGEKDWILIHPNNKLKVDMVINREGQQSGFSHLNVDKIDEDINPEVWDVPWEYVTLRGGDCLYLPYQYLHQVRSYERTISSTFLFYPGYDFTDNDCKEVNFDEPLNLTDAYVYWTYEKGQETVDMGYCNPIIIRDENEKMLKVTKKAKLNFRMFIYLEVIQHGHEIVESDTTLSRAFNDFDADGDEYVSADEFRNAGMEVWKRLCRGFENPHGPIKSQLGKNKKHSNETPDFAPRRSDRHIDSKDAFIFLKFVLRVRGKDNAITYPEFKKCVSVENGDAADAFIIFDTDFNGILTLEEVTNTTLKRLRDFSKMSYSLRGTHIKGGGLHEENVMQGTVASIKGLDAVPEELLIEEDEVNLGDVQTKLIKQFLKELRSETQKQGKLNANSFADFVKKLELDILEVENVDSDVFFRILDLEDKGFISTEDLNYYIENLPLEENSEYGPIDYIKRILSNMDIVMEFENRVAKKKPNYVAKKELGTMSVSAKTEL